VIGTAASIYTPRSNPPINTPELSMSTMTNVGSMWGWPRVDPIPHQSEWASSLDSAACHHSAFVQMTIIRGLMQLRANQCASDCNHSLRKRRKSLECCTHLSYIGLQLTATVTQTKGHEYDRANTSSIRLFLNSDHAPKSGRENLLGCGSLCSILCALYSVESAVSVLGEDSPEVSLTNLILRSAWSLTADGPSREYPPIGPLFHLY
jgi:hypothetical protein